LKAYVDLKSFKIYHLDIGLLRVMSELSAEIIIHKDAVFTEFNGAMTEQYVLQQLSGMSYIPNIYYWTTEATAEIDFLFSFKNAIIPVEVKAGENLHSKSLRVYREKYHPSLSICTSLANLFYKDGLLNIPLYLIFELQKLISDLSTSQRVEPPTSAVD